MSEQNPATTARQLAAVLEEGVVGPRQAWSYFTDGADTCLLATLAGLSAEKASRLIGGTSIVAHVAHLAFAMETSAAWIRGDHSPRDWQQSWSVMEVTDSEWIALQEQIQKHYESLLQAILQTPLSDERSLGGAVGAVAHVAYHLGAIRQKAACLHHLG